MDGLVGGGREEEREGLMDRQGSRQAGRQAGR